MGLFDRMKDQFVGSRLEEEAFYEAALREIESGGRRAGIWAKALATAKGDQEQAKGVYVRLLVKKLKDDQHIAKRLDEQRARERSEEERRQRAMEGARQDEMHLRKERLEVEQSRQNRLREKAAKQQNRLIEKAFKQRKKKERKEKRKLRLANIMRAVMPLVFLLAWPVIMFGVAYLILRFLSIN